MRKRVVGELLSWCWEYAHGPRGLRITYLLILRDDRCHELTDFVIVVAWDGRLRRDFVPFLREDACWHHFGGLTSGQSSLIILANLKWRFVPPFLCSLLLNKSRLGAWPRHVRLIATLTVHGSGAPLNLLQWLQYYRILSIRLHSTSILLREVKDEAGTSPLTMACYRPATWLRRIVNLLLEVVFIYRTLII